MFTVKVSGVPNSRRYLRNSRTPSSLTSMSKTKRLFRGPVGIPVLKRWLLKPGFCWHSCCLHLHLGSLPPGWQGNFQYVVKGLFSFSRFTILTFGFGVGCCFCPKNCSEGPGVGGGGVGGGVGGVVLVGFGFGFVVFVFV